MGEPLTLRLIPEWKQLASRLAQTLQKHCSPDEKDETIYLDVNPVIQFDYCCPYSDHLHCMTVYTGHDTNVALSFRWSHRQLKHQIDMWVDDGQGRLSHSATPVYGRYKIQKMLFLPSQRVLVAYCDDLKLRLLTNYGQKMAVLYHTQCPSSILSMHHCPKTNKLLTGGMGFIAFWGLWVSEREPLSLLRILDWNNSSLQPETMVSAFASQRETNYIYALCDHSVKSLEDKSELMEFQGDSVATLRCVVADSQQRYLYTGDANGYVQAWSCDIRRLLLEFLAHSNAVAALVLLPESGHILTASKSNSVKQWKPNGELVLRLPFEMPGGVRSMWGLGKNIVMCHSDTTLNVWRLNSVYKTFNNTCCRVRLLRRIECGTAKGRILALTLDGLIRFISTVTGELLLLSWPVSYIDRVQALAYDPAHGDLYICDGSADILVLNTMLNPCPVKHILNTSKKGSDSVLCLETVVVRSPCQTGDDRGSICLIFSGHRDGTLHLLAPHSLASEPKHGHKGAVCQMSGISGETASICCYGADLQFTLWSVKCDGQNVSLTLVRQMSCHLTPVHFKLMHGCVCVVSPLHHLLFFPLEGGQHMERERLKEDRISCLDYCPQLNILAACGETGKVEVWNHKGDLVAEVRLGVPVMQVCFGNARGDILASFSNSISIIPATKLLPTSYLRKVYEQAPVDDIIEYSIPFLPKSPSHYNIRTVPRIYLKDLKMDSLKTEAASDLRSPEYLHPDDSTTDEPDIKCMIKPYIPRARRRETMGLEDISLFLSRFAPDDMWDSSEEIHLLTRRSAEYFSSLSRCLPKGGYIPNSVVRGMYLDEQAEKKTLNLDWHVENKCAPKGLRRRCEEEQEMVVFSEQIQEVQEIKERAKASRPTEEVHKAHKVSSVEDSFHELESQVTIEGISEAKSNSEQQLMETFHQILDFLKTPDRKTYAEFSDKLFNIYKSLGGKSNLLKLMETQFMSDAENTTVEWRPVESLKNLHKLNLLHGEKLEMVGEFLAHTNPELRELVRGILKEEFQICDKSTLKKELQKSMRKETQNSMTVTQLNSLLSKLSEDLRLIPEEPTVSTVERIALPTSTGTSSSVESRYLVDPETLTPAEDLKLTRKALKFFRETPDIKERDKEASKTLTEEELKRLQMESERAKWGTESDVSQPKAKKTRAKSSKQTTPDKEQQGLRPNDPLLYAYRQSRRYGVPAELPQEITEPRLESALPPINSGLGSLRSQDISTEISSIAQGNGYLSMFGHLESQSKRHKPESHTKQYQPICRHPKRISHRPRFISQGRQQATYDYDYNDSQDTSQESRHIYPEHSSQSSKLMPEERLDIPNSDISQHPQMVLQSALQDSQHSAGLTVQQNVHDILERPQQVPHYSPKSPQYSSYTLPEGPATFHDQPPHSAQFSTGTPHYGHTASLTQAISSYQEPVDKRPFSSNFEQPVCAFQGPQTGTSGDLQPSPEQTQQSSRPRRDHHLQQQHTVQPYTQTRPQQPLLMAEPSQQALEVEVGRDPHWRQSFYKLIALYGFRSEKAAKASASHCLPLPRIQPRKRPMHQPPSPPRSLPNLHWKGALGERVMQTTKLAPLDKSLGTGRSLQPKMPLSWRLGHVPLHIQGQVRYGKLEMEWVRVDSNPVSQREKLHLPEVNKKSCLFQN